MPSESLRKLEIDANHAFDQYRDMYFEGGVSSVYLWDLDHGFAGILLIKKGLSICQACRQFAEINQQQKLTSGSYERQLMFLQV
jgi:capping protein (actin filament) muscle Z-line, beta